MIKMPAAMPNHRKNTVQQIGRVKFFPWKTVTDRTSTEQGKTCLFILQGKSRKARSVVSMLQSECSQQAVIQIGLRT